MIPVPPNVDREKVEAEYKDGVFHVMIGEAVEVARTEIPREGAMSINGG